MGNENSLISVIIPIYNGEKYLDRCIRSICNQTYSNLEIILINDGSADRTEEICNYWGKRDARIAYINSRNKGVSAARNLGLESSHGDYIGFVDADDVIEPNMYGVMLNRMIAEDAELACCTDSYRRENQQEISRTIVEEKVLKRQEILADFFRLRVPGGVCNKLIASSVINRGKIRFDTTITQNEDLLFFCSCAYSSNKCIMINQPFYIYYSHAASASHFMGDQVDWRKISYVKASNKMKYYIESGTMEEQIAWRIFHCSRLIDALGYLKKYNKDESVKYMVRKYKKEARLYILRFLLCKKISWNYKIIALIRIL